MPSDLEIALDDLKAGVHGVIAKVEEAISGQSPDMHEVHQGLYELRAAVEKEVATAKERLASLWPHPAAVPEQPIAEPIPIAQPAMPGDSAWTEKPLPEEHQN